MVMREGKPIQRMPEPKVLGASKGFPEPHGHVGRAWEMRRSNQGYFRSCF